MKNKTHGGARKGAGRKPPLGKATERKTIQLTPAEWAQLAKIHKTPSQAIRKILRDTQRERNENDKE